MPGRGRRCRERNGLIREVIDFRETILVDGRHVAGDHDPAPAARTRRSASTAPSRKMSFFLYQSDGRQACANLLFGDVDLGRSRPAPATVVPTPADMPKMSPEVVYDLGTTGPSRNFVYDMEIYRYFVRDDWQELLAHDADGTVDRGSFDAIEAAQIAGREFKVGIRGLAAGARRMGPDHEVFSLVGSGFLHTRAAAVRRPDPPARPRRAGDPARVPLLRLGRRVGLPADGRPARPSAASIPTRDGSADVRTRFACRWFVR